MAKANFVDYVKINLTSGDGGPGSRHFYRAKGIPKGGPDGGDGGRGGHIILRGNRNLWTLLQFKYKKHIRAEHGERGSENNKSGASGSDVVLEVPLGTIARDAETNELLVEVTDHGEEYVLLEGGRGGQGNSHFKSSTNQSPDYAQPGEPGTEGWYILELKVLADVGLVGLPNVGKSTLLSVVSAAKPEIANYEFTTLVPNLGMVQYRDGKSFAMADIPGIIEGAHEGKGLGHRFLRHIERNATLLFCIPADADDIKGQYRILLNELERYNPELLDKPRLLALTRADMVDEELKRMRAGEIPNDLPSIYISAVTGEGMTALKDTLYQLIITRREDYEGRQLAMEEE
ncbi:GTP-binding protein [Neolewinella xylanilytica]|uniref:GTPase Obg n=1 Tax=Neolewinella xylanilytica TaxID=1514080 RepID=A0A2S6I3G3_9BACT|nr:GTPase ObgE [Neolewinella xylanilytica]PPK85705.1 GTP-binding protein [Neolewinella xylanilytica]